MVPVNQQTKLLFELLSSLLLLKLITTLTAALRDDIQIDLVLCYTNSEVSLYWIRGLTMEWKPFVQNRVNAIRMLVPSDQWRHCAERTTQLTYVLLRRATSTDLVGSILWQYGLS